MTIETTANAIEHNHPSVEGYRMDCPRCKLNAAAPALLEALKDLYECYDHQVPVCCEEFVKHSYGQAKVAIKKAEGK